MPRSTINQIKEHGLENYLNATKQIHDGRGYREFLNLVNKQRPVAEIAKLFKVSRPTIYSWIKEMV